MRQKSALYRIAPYTEEKSKVCQKFPLTVLIAPMFSPPQSFLRAMTHVLLLSVTHEARVEERGEN